MFNTPTQDNCNHRILVIEDDAAIRRGVVDALKFAGYTVFEDGRGDAGLDTALRLDFDLLLLDIVLPGTDGLTILREIRRSRPGLPVILLTARGSEDDRVRGLDLGADDYVVKPFSARELLARVSAVLRRSGERRREQGDGVIGLEGMLIRLDDRQIEFENGNTVEITAQEALLLRYLAESHGHPVSRTELLKYVWRVNPGKNSESRMVDMMVARLRDKLGDTAEPRYLVTVRGSGYLLRTRTPAP